MRLARNSSKATDCASRSFRPGEAPVIPPRKLDGRPEARASRGAYIKERDIREQRRFERRTREADGELRAGDALQALLGQSPKPRAYANTAEESAERASFSATTLLASAARHRGLCLVCGALDTGLRASGLQVRPEPCEEGEPGCPGVGG